jgi:tol-pal system protein YbgF
MRLAVTVPSKHIERDMVFRPLAALLLAALTITPASAAWSQNQTEDAILPPAAIGGAQGEIIVAQESSLADMLARVQRLEGQNRQLTGRVDELTNAIRKIQQDFAKYREDMEFRIQELESAPADGKPKKRSEAPAATPGAVDTAAAGAVEAPAVETSLAPKALGTLPLDPALQDDGATAEADMSEPLDLTALPQINDTSRPSDGLQFPADAPQPAIDGTVQPAPGSAARTGLVPPGLPGLAGTASQPIVAAAPTNAPKDEFDLAYGFLQRKDYEIAEMSFRKFVTDHPDDALVPDATHWLGESLFQRKQFRDAAEYFLKVTTDYGKSRRAPSSMLRLGMSLSNLGEKEAACATLQGIAKKYPNASETVKTAVQRETARARC